MQILLKKFLCLMLAILSFQCQSSFSMDKGDSFWDETIEACQDWWARITNDPLPKQPIFYIVNLSDYQCRLEFIILGENAGKILLDKPASIIYPVSLTNLQREIEKKDGYKWRTELNDLTYKISKIMLENPPMPEVRLQLTYSSEIVFRPTKFVKSNIFLIIDSDQEKTYSVFCCFADFEVGKFLLNGSLGLPKDIGLHVLSYFFIFENAFDDGEEIKWEPRYD